MTITELNQQFSVPGQIEFSIGKGNLPIVILTNQYGTAVVSLYGAQVLSFMPKGEKDLLWMSKQSFFEEGKAIRGGIPLCFPWFGAHSTDSKKPQHGFARLSNWTVKSTSIIPGGSATITLALQDSPATQVFWPFSFNAELTVTVDTKLTVTLSYTNTSNKTFECSNALHTYLNVSDISKISIEGLHETSYYLPSGEGFKQTEKLLTISKEENRRYVNHIADCIIYDKGNKRNIRISKTNSKVTVVWNPGEAIAKTISDMDDNEHKTFICVEAANAFNNTIHLATGETFTVSTTIGLE